MNKKLSRNKDFVLVFLGQIVSNLGSSLHSVAIIWYIMDIIGENNAGRYVMGLQLCIVIPLLILSPIVGVYIDRASRKNIIVGTDYIRGFLTLILAFLFLNDLASIPVIFAITALLYSVGTFFNPAVNSLLPNIIDRENLMRANSLIGMSKKLAVVVGAALAGILYAPLGIAGLLLLDGISYVLSAISEMFITKQAKPERKTSEKSHFFKEFKDGLRYLGKQKLAIRILSYMIILNFITNPLVKVVLPKTMKFTLQVSSVKFGFFEAMIATGAIIGFLILSSLPKRKKYYSIVLTSSFISNVSLFIFGIALIPVISNFLGNNIIYIVFCLAIILLLASVVLIDVPIMTYFQMSVPDEYRGRFFGTTETIAQAIIPIGTLLYGLLVDMVDSMYLFIGSGILFLLATVFIMLRKDVRVI